MNGTLGHLCECDFQLPFSKYFINVAHVHGTGVLLLDTVHTTEMSEVGKPWEVGGGGTGARGERREGRTMPLEINSDN